jgi:hypothetical protein
MPIGRRAIEQRIQFETDELHPESESLTMKQMELCLA